MDIERKNTADEKFPKGKAVGFALTRASSIISSVIIGEIVYFGTNSLGLTAAAISAGMAVKTVIDAVTDLGMGALIDSTKSKWGKARPYSLAGVLVWLCIMAIYAVPTGWFANLSQQAKNTAIIIYITVFATLASAVFETMRGIAYDTHLKRSIVNDDNRIKIMTISGLVFTVGTLGLQIALPQIIESFHGGQQGFIILAVVTGVIGIIASIACFLLCPEYTDDELLAYGGYDKSEVKEKVSIGEFLKSVGKNKYIIMWTVINFAMLILINGSFITGQYYFEVYYGDLGAFSMLMIFSAVIVPVIFFMPKLCKKFGVVNVIRGSLVIAAAGLIVRMIFPHSFIALIIGYVCLAVPQLPITFVGSQVTIECMEYGTYKTGVVAEAMYSSFTSFSQKMSGSFSTMIVGIILSATGYDALTTAVKQNGFADWAELAALGSAGFEQYIEGGVATVNSAMSGIYAVYNYIPLVAVILIAALMIPFHLEKDLKKLRVEHGLNEDGSQKEA